MDIYSIEAEPGVLGISAMPGLAFGLTADVAALAAWGAGLVLTMTGTGEMERMGFKGIAALLAAKGIAWRHLPVEDWGAPSEPVQRLWPDASEEAHRILDQGGKVLTHCRAGCGRSGMAALRLLVERGEEAEAALHRLRGVRPCAVETNGQFGWAAGGAGRRA